nr:putative DNA-directed RNA polymerases III, 39 kDa polypeptide [Cryptomonas sp.]
MSIQKMPVFVARYIFSSDFEKSSLLAACCEINFNFNHLSKLTNQTCSFDSMLSCLDDLILLKLIKEIKNTVNYPNIKSSISHYFCDYNDKKTLLSEDNLTEKKKTLSDDFNNFQTINEILETEDNTEYFYKENEIFFIEREIFFFVFKSKHQGCTKTDLTVFTKKSKIISSKSKRLFSRLFLNHLEKINIIKVKHWTCFLNSKKKKYITGLNYSEILEEKHKKIRYINEFFIYPMLSISLPPCINCPVISECHPQSIVNPFDCRYIDKWSEKN